MTCLEGSRANCSMLFQAQLSETSVQQVVHPVKTIR